MAVNTLTITGKVGPAITVTSLIIPNVTSITFDLLAQAIRVAYLNTSGAPKIQNFDLAVEATVTYVIASGIATITIST